MLNNYFLIAIRNLAKHRVFSIINILGLAFGLFCFMLIALWVWDELRIDGFHSNSENIYQVLGEINSSGESIIWEYAPSSLANPILDRLPEVRRICRVFPAQVVMVQSDIRFSEIGIYADPSLFNIFSFPLKEGAANQLSAPNAIVITAELAEKYFPGESALGKNIGIVEDKMASYVVAGVMENLPEYSSLQFDYVIGYESFENKFRPWWKSTNKASFNNFNVNLYAELEPGVNVERLNEKLNTFISDYTGVHSDNAIFAYPFKEVYLHGDFSEGRNPTGRIKYVNLLSLAAVIVFLIACINFINLSTAMAGKRAKEVGLRKVAGASKIQLVKQFLLESVMISLCAMIIALTLVEIILPVFNAVIQKRIEVPYNSPILIVIIIGITVMAGLLAGSYPAFVLAAFEPSKSLRNVKTGNLGLSFVRKGLVIIQFVTSITFIIYTIVVFNQISFIQNKELGIRKDNIIHHLLHGIRNNTEAYRNDLLKIKGIQSVSFTEQDPMNTSNGNSHVTWRGKPENADIFFNIIQVGDDYLETFDLEIIRGSGFTNINSNSSQKQVIINEAAAKAMMVDDPVGMQLQVWGYEGTIMGIVKDYHHRSLTQSIEPIIIIYNPSQTWRAYISIAGNDIQATLRDIKKTYQDYEKEFPFDYFFVDDQFQNSYREIATIGKLGNMFSAAAIIISCLGLFGLSAFIVEQKRVETGIRKTFGANTTNLVYKFSMDFVKLVLVSITIALPISWYYAEQWLSDFAYHTSIGFTPFVVAGASALTIAWLTVGYNTIRAAQANPVDLLREL